MKRGFRGIAAFLLLLCVSTAALSAEKVNLTFMFWGSPAEDSAIRKALKDFEVANPEISVTPLYAVYSGAEYDAKMKAMSESGTLARMWAISEGSSSSTHRTTSSWT